MILLTGAYRLFFPAAGLFAGLAIPFWLMLYAGAVTATPDALAWHMHEMLYGYLPAALAGFLLTAIPNWTGRPAIQGLPLLALFLLWLGGRVGVFLALGSLTGAILTLAFLPVLALIAGRDIVLSGNRRNLIVVALIAMLAGGQAVFLFADHDLGLNIGFATALMLMTLVGGRVTPAFTRNWLTKRGVKSLPAPFGPIDKAAMALTGATALTWVAAPQSSVTGLVAGAAALALLARLSRWRGAHVLGEPLLLALHLAYLWLGVALALLSLSILTDLATQGQVRHALGAAAVGGMTMIVMLRAILGHSGRAIDGTGLDWLMLGAVHLGAALRVLTGWTDDATMLLHLAGTLWALGFLLFTARVLPIALAPRQ